MVSKKNRRHSGRYTPRLVCGGMKYSDMKDEALEPMEVYDDWTDYRDGMRDWPYLEWKKKDKQKRRKFPYKRGGKKRCEKKK